MSLGQYDSRTCDCHRAQVIISLQIYSHRKQNCPKYWQVLATSGRFPSSASCLARLVRFPGSVKGIPWRRFWRVNLALPRFLASLVLERCEHLSIFLPLNLFYQQTTLLRAVLTPEEYHVFHVDLRIAGFADLTSFFTSFSRQLETYLQEMARDEGCGTLRLHAVKLRVR